MEYFLYGATICLSCLTLTSFYYTYKFAMLVLDIQDDIEDSLDELDQSFVLNYIKIKKILSQII